MDGEETEIQPVGEAMTGCWMTAGEHQITMRYTPQGFVEGAAISVISLLILVLGIAGKAIDKQRVCDIIILRKNQYRDFLSIFIGIIVDQRVMYCMIR